VKRFFLKKSKKLYPIRYSIQREANLKNNWPRQFPSLQMGKSFLLLFFKKEALPSA